MGLPEPRWAAFPSGGLGRPFLEAVAAFGCHLKGALFVGMDRASVVTMLARPSEILGACLSS
jgi:hypothetical protein